MKKPLLATNPSMRISMRQAALQSFCVFQQALSKAHGGNCLNVFSGTAVSKNRAKPAHYHLIEENETRFFELSRLDQRFLEQALVIYQKNIVCN